MVDTVAELGIKITDNAQASKANLDALNQSAQKLGTTTDDLNKKMASATSGMAANAGVSEKLDAIVQKTGASYAAANAFLAQSVIAQNNVKTAVAATTKEVETHASAISSLGLSLGRLPSLMVPIAAGFGIFAGAAGVALLALTKVNDEVARTQSRFAAMTGSQAQGTKALNDAKDAANRAGVAQDTMNAAVLRASEGFDKAADRNVIYANSTQRVTDQAKSFEGALTTVGQMLQANGANADEDKKVYSALANSIAETGTVTVKAFQTIRDISPGTARAIAQAFGKDDINEFQKQLALTPIPLEQLEQILKRVAPAWQAIADATPIDTVKQATEQLHQEWSNFLNTLSQTGAVVVAKDALIGLTNIIKTVTDGNWLQSTSMSDAIEKWAGGIITALNEGIKQPILSWLSSTSISDAVASWVYNNVVAPVIAGIQKAASLIAGAASNPGNVPASGNPMGDSGSGGETVPNITAGGTDYASAVGNGTYPAFASGTDSAPGGPSLINEQGGEIVNLPDGSQVIPHDVSMQMAGGASVKQITDAISQSTIDISKAVIATSNNVVSALNKIAGGGSAASNPTTGLALPSSASASSAAVNPLTGQPVTTGGGGGGFTLKNSPTDIAKAQQLAAYYKTQSVGEGGYDPMYAAAYGVGVRGGRGSGTFPAGAPINPASLSPVNPNYDPSSSTTGYPSGLGGEDARSSLDYGMGTSVVGASGVYSSDYGGSGFGSLSGGFDPNAMNYGGGSADYGYFKEGGQFTVGGPDGVDKSIVKIHASKGEVVTVTPKGVSVPSFGSGSGGGSGSSDPSQNVSGGSNTSTKNVVINVMPGIQADSFIKSRAQIARGL